MSRSWNGESLVNEVAALLGDTSAAFKTKVLGWLNDGIFDISSRHDWGHHLVKGRKLLTPSEEFNSLEISPPDAPDIALADGGNLSNGSTYSVIATFTQDNGVETQAGDESEVITCDTDSKSISLTNIPTSIETLITGRKIYLSKDDGPYYLHTTLADTYTTSLTIDEDTDSTIEPPDYESIRRLKGSPFFEESPSVYLEYRDYDQLRLLIQGQWSEGSPQYFSPIESNKIALYPIPGSELDLSFSYYRTPFRLYNEADSQPDLPIYLKPVLKAYAIAAGYEYRDRAGQELKKANYENALVDAINRGGRVANIEYTVRDVYGNLNGMEIG
jgi:hypothetical protein